MLMHSLRTVSQRIQGPLPLAPVFPKAHVETSNQKNLRLETTLANVVIRSAESVLLAN